LERRKLKGYFALPKYGISSLGIARVLKKILVTH